MKKLLIIAGVGVGVYAVFFLKGLDGKTLWQRKFGENEEPKEPKTSNADGCDCGCSENDNNSSSRTFRIKNIRADINYKPNK